jgi:hypothetical protein
MLGAAAQPSDAMVLRGENGVVVRAENGAQDTQDTQDTQDAQGTHVAPVAKDQQTEQVSQEARVASQEAAVAHESDAQVDPLKETELDAWRAELMLLAWLPGLEGTVGVRGQTATASASFADIIDSSDSLFGIAGRLEIGRGRWGAFVEGLYNRVTDENASGPLGQADIDITFQETLIDCGLMYRLLGPTSKAEFSEPTETALDLYAGARVTSLSVELDPATLNRVSGDRTWADPIIGARVGVPLRDLVDLPFRIVASGDVGGFGAASDFTWSATAYIAYDFRLFGTPASILLGYRAVGWDYTTGEGSNEFTWDVIQHGALLGLSVRF